MMGVRDPFLDRLRCLAEHRPRWVHGPIVDSSRRVWILAAMGPWNRRDFLRASLGLAGLSLLAGCGAVPAPGQGTARMPRIGFLAPAHRRGLLRGLREHGYETGRTIQIEYRFSEGQNERLPGLGPSWSTCSPISS